MQYIFFKNIVDKIALIAWFTRRQLINFNELLVLWKKLSVALVKCYVLQAIKIGKTKIYWWLKSIEISMASFSIFFANIYENKGNNALPWCRVRAAFLSMELEWNNIKSNGGSKFLQNIFWARARAFVNFFYRCIREKKNDRSKSPIFKKKCNWTVKIHFY